MPDIQLKNGQEIIKWIEALETAKAEHEAAALSIGKELADIRDRLNGRVRKPKSGQFTRRKKGEKAAAYVTDLIGFCPDV